MNKRTAFFIDTIPVIILAIGGLIYYSAHLIYSSSHKAHTSNESTIPKTLETVEEMTPGCDYLIINDGPKKIVFIHKKTCRNHKKR